MPEMHAGASGGVGRTPTTQTNAACGYSDCEERRWLDDEGNPVEPGPATRENPGTVYWDTVNNRLSWWCIDHMYDVVECGACGTQAHADNVVDSGIGYLCAECSPRYARCGQCGCTDTIDSIRWHPAYPGPACFHCRRRVRQCTRCGEWHTSRHFHRDITPPSNTCDNCYVRWIDSLHVRALEYKKQGLPNKERRFLAFGTELETEFPDNGPPFSVGGYHSENPAEPPFFGGWKCEYDGTLSSGAELISPILEGVGGMAEVLATMEILKEKGGRMLQSCGGHVTVAMPGPARCLKAQKLFTLFEEAAFALTGSYGRYRRGSYTTPLKQAGYRDLGDGFPYHDKYVSCRNKRHCVEYRHPPGTLNPEQFAINLGVAQLVSKLAINMSERDVEDAFVSGTGIWAGVYSGPYPDITKVHRFVLLGLEVFRAHGWHAKAADARRRVTFNGLPYNPAKPGKVKVVDTARGIEREVELPSAVRIVGRMDRQVSQFYARMFEGYEGEAAGARDAMTDEALSLVYGEPIEGLFDTPGSKVKTPLKMGIDARDTDERIEDPLV